MSPWLFNIYMDGVMREVKGKVGEVGVKLYNEGRKWVLNSILFADERVIVTEVTLIVCKEHCVISK